MIPGPLNHPIKNFLIQGGTLFEGTEGAANQAARNTREKFMAVAEPEKKPSLNGVASHVETAPPKRRKSKGRVTVTRKAGASCNICKSKFKGQHGVAVHKQRMHNGSAKEETPTRNTALKKYEKLRKLWLTKASTASDPKVSATIFECLLDLNSEFTR